MFDFRTASARRLASAATVPTSSTSECEWCGHAHDRTALCTKRPTFGRRGFLALLGAGLTGMALPGDLALAGKHNWVFKLGQPTAQLWSFVMSFDDEVIAATLTDNPAIVTGSEAVVDAADGTKIRWSRIG
jgi:hypothetical protein